MSGLYCLLLFSLVKRYEHKHIDLSFFWCKGQPCRSPVCASDLRRLNECVCSWTHQGAVPVSDAMGNGTLLTAWAGERRCGLHCGHRRRRMSRGRFDRQMGCKWGWGTGQSHYSSREERGSRSRKGPPKGWPGVAGRGRRRYRGTGWALGDAAEPSHGKTRCFPTMMQI